MSEIPALLSKMEGIESGTCKGSKPDQPGLYSIEKQRMGHVSNKAEDPDLQSYFLTSTHVLLEAHAYNINLHECT